MTRRFRRPKAVWAVAFYGVALLMTIALIAALTLVRPQPRPARKTSLAGQGCAPDAKTRRSFAHAGV